MTQKYQVKVSMKQAAIVETGIVLKQGDFGMQIEIEVLDFDVTGTTPQIVFRKAMGAVESTTITVSSNKYTYTFKGTELDTPGKVFCDLKLKNSTTQRISTASFMFKVVADTLDGLAEESSSYSDTIAQIASTLQGYSEDSEAWAKGTVNGTPVPNTAEQYHNNAKYYSDIASEAAATAPFVLASKTVDNSYTDLNEFVKMGIYSLPSQNNYANDPIGTNKTRILVTIVNMYNNPTAQVIFERTSGEIYFRSYTNRAWNAWSFKVLDDINKLNNNDISIDSSLSILYDTFGYNNASFTVGKQLNINGGIYDNQRSVATEGYLKIKKGSSIMCISSDVVLSVATYTSNSLSDFKAIYQKLVNESYCADEDIWVRISVALRNSGTATLDILKKCVFCLMDADFTPINTRISTLETKVQANESEITILDTYTGYVENGFEFEVGALYPSDGQEATNNARARSGYIPVKKGSVIKVVNSGYDQMVLEYTTNKWYNNYTHNQSSPSFNHNDYTAHYDNVAYVRIVTKRTDGANITSTDLTNLKTAFNIIDPREEYPLISAEAVPNEIFSTETVYFDENRDLTYTEIIGGYDDLVTNYPEYVTKKTLGIDSSGNYTIYQYIFEPKGTPKVTYNFNGKTYDIPTIVLEAGVHGSERPIVKGLLNAMALICKKWDENPVLAYLRFNYRIIVNPCAVPFGYQGKGGRFNANGVNINRNFNGMNTWQYGSSTPGDPNYRGESPLSEVEAQYVYNTIAENSKDIVLYHSFHTYGQFDSYKKMMCWAWGTYTKTNEMYVAGENVLKQISRNAWTKHNCQYNAGDLIGSMQAENGIGGWEGYRGGYTVNMGNSFGIPSASPEGIYYYYGDSSTANSHDINCLNTEYIIITTIEALRQLI